MLVLFQRVYVLEKKNASKCYHATMLGKVIQPKEREWWEPAICSKPVRSTTKSLALASEVEGSLMGLSPVSVESDAISRYTESELS